MKTGVINKVHPQKDFKCIKGENITTGVIHDKISNKKNVKYKSYLAE